LKGPGFLSLFLFIATPLFSTEIFTKGINLTEWFQEPAVRSIQANKYTKKDFEDIKSLGCDVIRLPINLHAMTGGAPDYIIDPMLFKFLDRAVDICEELNISLILDNHSDSDKMTDPSVGDILSKIWTQIAGHYKSRGSLLYYEILNEPHGISPAAWGMIEKNVINKIRQIDKKHTIIAGGAGWNDIDSLSKLPDFDDDNIIYTFHFYDPMLFTHQGAAWLKPPQTSLKGIPYPYDKKRMPPCPSDLLNTWVQKKLSMEYPSEANNGALEKTILKAVDFRAKTGKIVYCGEFGVLNKNAQDGDRFYWYDSVRKILEKYSIPRTSWDYRSSFGLFKKDSDEVFDYDLDIPIVMALGLNPPSFNELKIKPETNGFYIFDNYPAPGLAVASYTINGSIGLYDTESPENGKYSIDMDNLDRYDRLNFSFKPAKDLSELLERKCSVVIKLKLKPGFKNVDIRFLSVRKDDPVSRPWRIRYTLDDKTLKKSGDWQTVYVGLDKFTEQGAWKDKWYNPEGLFDWRSITGFEVVSENEKWQNTGLLIAQISLSLIE
jgi:endoglucanase